ncbi:hypothetical protein AB1Y20_022983 [Prymnesium parvum]|uniref:Protein DETOXIFICATION n=1 Tax=Prymnesium parvum TaxID=97485 RepID=A0AB34JEU4_PRYPA
MASLRLLTLSLAGSLTFIPLLAASSIASSHGYLLGSGAHYAVPPPSHECSPRVMIAAPHTRSSCRRRRPLVMVAHSKLHLSHKRQIDAEFLRIALPAFAQFAAEPLARLVDTAYLGRLGTVALGGAGAAIAAQYAIAKLYNDPLLRSTISIVASQEGAGADARADAAASALALALVVGLAQALFYLIFAGPILTASCVGPSSEMRSAALGYLRVCAIGAPTTTVWLVCNGIYRGLGDTSTPLLWALVFTVLNLVFDGIFIFPLGMGSGPWQALYANSEDTAHEAGC